MLWAKKSVNIIINNWCDQSKKKEKKEWDKLIRNNPKWKMGKLIKIRGSIRYLMVFACLSSQVFIKTVKYFLLALIWFFCLIKTDVSLLQIMFPLFFNGFCWS